MDARSGALDEAALTSWLREHVGIPVPVSFHLLAGGHSNLTYEVTDATGERWVLRRPPLGDVPPKAHDMVREHGILSALAATDVPVAPTVALCTDSSVTGAAFYVMRFVDGVVLADAEVASVLGPPARRRAGLTAADTLAQIHGVDPDAVGLGSLGKRDGYVARQLARWYALWEATPTEHDPLVPALHDQLAADLPVEGPATLVHGDYRLENCIVTEMGSLAAVLDWELCTLGDPLADLGLLAIYWTDPADVEPIFPTAPTVVEGFPRREEVVARYADRSRRDVSMLDYYVAFGYWKLACISATVHARYESGAMGNRTAYDLLGSQSARCARAAARLLGG